MRVDTRDWRSHLEQMHTYRSFNCYYDCDDNDDDEKEEEYYIIVEHQDRHRGLAGEHEEPLGPTAGKSDRQNVYRLTFN